jgi:hypothetical protein
MRVWKASLAVIMLMGVLLTPSAVAAAAPAGGAVQIWVTVNATSNSATMPILVTGAIGDYGKATSHDKSGKVDSNGDYVTVALQKGSFQVNSVALDKKFKNVQPTVNPTTCSAYFSGSGAVTLSAGTGAYQGITGTVTITETFAFIGPRYKTGAKKGQCNESNNSQPIAGYGSLSGVGTVSFS